MKTLIIVNPASSRGETAQAWQKAKPSFGLAIDNLEAVMTEFPGHAEKLARGALQEGFEWIICLGGDGTLNEVVNGFFQEGKPVNQDAVLSVISSGTGGDFRRSLAMPREPEAALAHLMKAKTKSIDAGRITFTCHDGREKSRHFLNIASFGMSGEVDRRVNLARNSRLSPASAFVLASLSTFLSYQNKLVRLTVDGTVIDSRIRLGLVCNGRYAGGGMMFAPHARLDDNKFDVVVIGDLSALRTALNFPRLYRGTHLGRKGVVFLRGSEIRATSDEEVLLDVDGEDPGRLPADITLLPAAIKLRGFSAQS